MTTSTDGKKQQKPREPKIGAQQRAYVFFRLVIPRIPKRKILDTALCREMCAESNANGKMYWEWTNKETNIFENATKLSKFIFVGTYKTVDLKKVKLRNLLTMWESEQTKDGEAENLEKKMLSICWPEEDEVLYYTTLLEQARKIAPSRGGGAASPDRATAARAAAAAAAAARAAAPATAAPAPGAAPASAAAPAFQGNLSPEMVGELEQTLFGMGYDRTSTLKQIKAAQNAGQLTPKSNIGKCNLLVL